MYAKSLGVEFLGIISKFIKMKKISTRSRAVKAKNVQQNAMHVSSLVFLSLAVLRSKTLKTMAGRRMK